MIRFIGQRDQFRCGPIALVNVLKWAGIKEWKGCRVNTQLARDYMSARCRTYRDIGTYPDDLEPILFSLPLNIKKMRKTTIKRIDNMLNNGIFLINTYCHDRDDWHYFLIVDRIPIKNSLYIVVNYVQDKYPTSTINRKTLKQLFSWPGARIYHVTKK